MKVVNLHFAKTHLSKLVEEAAAGDEIVIAKAGKPLVRLVSVASTAASRTLGQLAGQVKESPTAWLPDSALEHSFYYGTIEPTRAPRVAETPQPRKRK